MSLRFFPALSALLSMEVCAAAACGTVERAGQSDKVDQTDAGMSGDAGSIDVNWQNAAVRSASSSARTLCAVMSSGRLTCWGQDESLGLLGDNGVSAHSLNVPTAVGTASNWTQVSSGPYMHCAQNAARETWCWGHAAAPGFGDAALTASVYAQPVKTSLAFTHLALGEYHACGLRDDGTLHCWGDNSYGQLGVTSARSSTPLQVDARSYQSVAVGKNHTCALDRDGAVWCFGRNYDQELGNAQAETLALPTRVAVDGVVELGCAATSCCARKRDQSVWCWGDAQAPHSIASGIQRMRVLPDATCMVSLDGSVACYGASSTESIASAGTEVPDVIGGVGYRCLLIDGSFSCRGDNTDADGVLGRGVSGVETSFTSVDSGWTQLGLNARGGCGIGQDGALRCWGQSWGTRPTQVSADRDWTALSVASSHACAIRAGRLSCWGAGTSGQLGNGLADSATPLEVAGTWSQVSVGDGLSCARDDAQALFCWGAAPGQGAMPRKLDDAQWLDVSVAAQRVTAIRSDGTLWAWTATGQTQLGMGSSWVHTLTTSSGDSCALDKDGMASCTLSDGVTLANLTAAPGNRRLFDMPDGVCLAQRDDSLACFVSAGMSDHGGSHGWDVATGYGGDGMSALPSGAVTTLVGGWDLRCLLRPSGERLCAGRRQDGSFGDGLDDSALTTVLPRM